MEGQTNSSSVSAESDRIQGRPGSSGPDGIPGRPGLVVPGSPTRLPQPSIGRGSSTPDPVNVGIPGRGAPRPGSPGSPAFPGFNSARPGVQPPTFSFSASAGFQGWYL